MGRLGGEGGQKAHHVRAGGQGQDPAFL
jgi:hypothetical protein